MGQRCKEGELWFTVYHQKNLIVDWHFSNCIYTRKIVNCSRCSSPPELAALTMLLFHWFFLSPSKLKLPGLVSTNDSHIWSILWRDSRVPVRGGTWQTCAGKHQGLLELAISRGEQEDCVPTALRNVSLWNPVDRWALCNHRLRMNYFTAEIQIRLMCFCSVLCSRRSQTQ